ncbi:hypothetical protein Tco_1135080 [Tanacetum coccineum]
MVKSKKETLCEEVYGKEKNYPLSTTKLKRYGEELKTKTSKKLKFDDKDIPSIEEKVVEVKEEEQVKRTGKRKNGGYDPTPLTTKSDSVANWKIFQQGQRSVYQIIRANGADIVYMSFELYDVKTTQRDLKDRKYPLSKEACQVMLKMKLLDGKMNEVCYKLLKMIKKQAGVRK